MPRLTLADLKDQVYARLEQNTEMYQGQEVTDAINEAVNCINLICAWYQKTYPISTYSTIANRHIYDVPEQVVFPQRVIFEGQVLEKTSIEVMANNWPQFLKDTTQSVGKQVSRWVPLGIRKFAIHPADSVGGARVEVTGIAEVDKLVNDADLIYIPKEGVTAVCDYAAHVVQCKLQGLPFYQSMSMFKNYQDLVKLQKFWLSYRQPTIYFEEQSPAKG